MSKGNGRNVGVAGLLQRLMVHARISHDQHARLQELAGDLIGEGARRKAAGNGARASVPFQKLLAKRFFTETGFGVTGQI